jgi:heme oxygenase (mycobilin-producing)
VHSYFFGPGMQNRLRLDRVTEGDTAPSPGLRSSVDASLTLDSHHSVAFERHGSTEAPPARDAQRAADRAMMESMTIVRINAITVPEGGGDELARRFSERAGAVDEADGFEGFELLRPTDDRQTWLVLTRWRDAEAFEAWVASPAFAHGHRGAGQGTDRPTSSTHSELWSFDIAVAVRR